MKQRLKGENVGMSLEDVNYGVFEPGEFDDYIQGKMRRVALAPNGEVVGIHDKNNTNKWEDGTDVNWTEYESNLWNCMVQIPKFYYRTFRDEYRGMDTYRCEISPTEKNGFKLHPAFMRNGIERSHQYMSAFEGWRDADGKLRSLPNKTVTVSRTLLNFRLDATKNGGNFTLQELQLTSAIQMLYLIEYGNFNAQDKIADGNISNSYVATGKSMSLGNFSGGDGTYMSYRGIENFYANYWKTLDGINIKEREMFVCTDTNFESDKFTDNYVSSGFVAPNSGYISDFGYSESFDYMFLPTSNVGGSASSALADYVYSNTGNRVAFFGGFRIYGAYCGCFALSLNQAAASSAANYAARLQYI